MVHLRAWIRQRILCFTCTAINKTREQSSPPTHNFESSHAPGLATPPQLNSETPQPAHQVDGTQQINFLMPPKRKAQETVAMDRTEKRPRTAKKGKKTVPAAEDPPGCKSISVISGCLAQHNQSTFIGKDSRKKTQHSLQLSRL